MEETHGRVLQDSVGGCRGCDLRLLDKVAVHAMDTAGCIAADVPAAVVGAGCVDFLITQIRQVCWWRGLCGTVAMSAEDVDSQHILRGYLAAEQEKERQGRVVHDDGMRSGSSLQWSTSEAAGWKRSSHSIQDRSSYLTVCPI